MIVGGPAKRSYPTRVAEVERFVRTICVANDADARDQFRAAVNFLFTESFLMRSIDHHAGPSRFGVSNHELVEEHLAIAGRGTDGSPAGYRGEAPDARRSDHSPLPGYSLLSRRRGH